MNAYKCICKCSRASYRCPSCWSVRKATHVTVAVSTLSTRARLSRDDVMTSCRDGAEVTEQDWAWDVRVRLQDSWWTPSLDSDAAWRHHQLFSRRLDHLLVIMHHKAYRITSTSRLTIILPRTATHSRYMLYCLTEIHIEYLWLCNLERPVRSKPFRIF